MGFARSWKRVQELPKEEFLKFSEDCMMICEYATKDEDIQLAGPGGVGNPRFSSDRVALNGDMTKKEDYESFCIERVVPDSRYLVVDKCGLIFGSVKTGKRPYDKVVLACLIAAKYYFKDQIYLEGVGEAQEWMDAIVLASAGVGGDLLKVSEVMFDRPTEEMRIAWEKKQREEKEQEKARKPTSHSISCTETAKLVKKALKEKFPKQKFSVRSDQYSLGSSIRVSWTDGPSEDSVEKVAGHFRGATFDGMTDCKNLLDSPYCNDYIFFDRELSRDLYMSEVRRLSAKYGFELPADLQYNKVYDVLYNLGRSGKNNLDLERKVLNTIRSTDYV